MGDDDSRTKGGGKPGKHDKPKLFAIDGGQPPDSVEGMDDLEADEALPSSSSSYLSPEQRVAEAERELALALVQVASETHWNDEDAALENVERALELDPLCAAAHSQRGWLLRYWHKDAIRCHTRALALEPMNAEYYRGRADQYKFHGQLALALADYNRAVSLDPKDMLSRRERARLLVQMGRLEEAFVEFGRALRCAPDHRGPLHRERLAVLRLMGEEPRLLQEIDAVLLEDPSHWAAWSERAFHHVRRGEWGAARRFLTVEIDRLSESFYPYTRYARAVCALWDGDARAALGDATIALKAEPTQQYFLLCRAEAHALLGNQAAALADLTAASRPDSHEENAFIACARFIVSNAAAPPELALAHARAAVRLAPKEASHRADVAWSLLACGKVQAARREMAAATRLHGAAQRRKRKPQEGATSDFRIRHYTTLQYAGYGLDLRLPRRHSTAEMRALRTRIEQAATKRRAR